MIPYVDLRRKFHELTVSELEDPELLIARQDYRLDSGIGWLELLEHPRVVLLAEAGAGKTHEMMEQARRLVSEGKYAFFVPLEGLQHGAFAEQLSSRSDEARFNDWKADGQATGWFFLDSVDELKLTEGKLDRALARFAKDIDGHQRRTCVVISSRPSDWQANFDLATVNARLPGVSETDRFEAAAEPVPEDVFIERLKTREAVKRRNVKKRSEADASGFKTVIMLPMSTVQITRFAEAQGIADIAAFLAELDRQNAWIFARRPLDLGDLVATWLRDGKLGTRAQQHAANVVAKLRDDPLRPDAGVLADEKARSGAERLALALALTRSRTLRSPEQALHSGRTDGVLDPADILVEWTAKERLALLRRGLFDPATYGRVRFHHRSVQEYLAACRLHHLRGKGMARRALFRVLFGERYGCQVVLPSMRAIAAWLAIWDGDVGAELMKREPEALLTHGDPESLGMSAREALLRRFAELYGIGGWRGLNIPHDEVRRLAHPMLAQVVRELWGKGPENEDLRELLLEVIWKGGITACVDLAEAAATNPDFRPHERVTAVLSLIEIRDDGALRRITQHLLSVPQDWPAQVVHGISDRLFPTWLSVKGLRRLIRRTPEPERTIGGFAWTLMQIAERVDLASTTAVELRNMLAWTMFRGRRSVRQDSYRLRSRFEHLRDALAVLCERQLALDDEMDMVGLIQSSIVAFRFSDRNDSDKRLQRLQEAFAKKPMSRSAAFWWELRLIDRIMPALDKSHRTYALAQQSLLERVVQEDRNWLEDALADRSWPQLRSVALHFLLDLWLAGNEKARELTHLKALVADDTDLLAVVRQRSDTKSHRAQRRKWNEQEDRRRRLKLAKEAKRLDGWRRWRDDVVSNPDEAFSEKRQYNSLYHIYHWMGSLQESSGRYAIWNLDLIEQAFSREVAVRTERTTAATWRNEPPMLWSQRKPDDRNATLYLWIYALGGLGIEAARPGWTGGLTREQVERAASYATIELNGLAPFVADLARSYPEVVEMVLGNELDAQLNHADAFDHLPILQDIAHSDGCVRSVLKRRLVAAISRIATQIPSSNRATNHIEQLLRALHDILDGNEALEVAETCAKAYLAEPRAAAAHTWLRQLFRLDAERGADVLTAILDDSGDPDLVSYAVEAFAALFGGHSAEVQEISDVAVRARTYARLVRSAYAFIKSREDKRHDGLFSPDVRDRAEQARNYLLSALLETPGADAQRLILELADEPDFAHFPDRLRILARQRAANDAEFVPFRPADIVGLDSRNELPCTSRDGLFEVMMDRLYELEHYFVHHDFSDRRTVRSIADENEMQRTLASRLEAKANGAYQVTREEEVADSKRSDIRLLSTGGSQKAVIELKLADARCSIADLERALEHQLVGQYLRHDSCRAGCLLLTYDGTKIRWRHSGSRKNMSFEQVVRHLGERAMALEASHGHVFRLSVFGLDLRDPVLVPAHI